MAQSETVSRILDSAEQMARQGGYNSFSFRDIAAEIGIKSASIHYHFHTKEDLGAALAERYTDRFMAALGAPDGDTPDRMLARYVAAYRAALADDGLMCLCGMFGAEIAHLPDVVAGRTREFFRRNLDWLGQVYTAAGASDPATRAAAMIATLEGAMILARTLDDLAVFDRIAASQAGQPAGE